MRIAQLAPLAERVPPKKYGGTERVVHALTEELVARGHDVTLFASGDSLTSARLHAVAPRALREANLVDIYGTNAWSLINMGEVFAREANFDVIHDHIGFLSLPTAHIATKPVITTLHGPLTSDLVAICRHFRRAHLVSISDAQQRGAPDLTFAGTVYNGLPMDEYPYSAEDEGYLLVVGRISMEKGVHLAVRLAHELGMRLIIAAKLEPTDTPYFEQYVEPFLGPTIEWVGEVDEEERNKLYSKAHALLHLITWPEPFGLVMIEAMACGCPVVALNKGSVSELVVHGTTGFIAEDYEGARDMLKNVTTIDRAVCRDYARTTFSVKRMTDGYEALYGKVTRGPQTGLPPRYLLRT